MTLWNLMQWTPSALDTYDIPDGVSRDILNQCILLRCGGLTLLRDDPTEAEYAINTWFAANKIRFTRLFATENFDYKPIDNMDVYIDAAGEARSDADSETENKVAAYNADIYSPDSQSTTNSGSTSTTGSNEHRRGLSGGYTYQDLVERERRASDWSFYESIAKKFEYAHCISVY